VQLDPNWAARVPRLAIAARPEPQPRTRQPDPEPEVPPGADAITRSLIQLKSSDINRKKQAIERLQRSTPDGRVDQVVQALVPLLVDDDLFLVHTVEKALAVWRSPEAMTGLIARLGDNRPFVRSEAIKALGKYQDIRAAEAIVTVIKDDGFAAEDALKGMGQLAEPAVIPLLRHGESRLRSTACDILAVIGGQETLKTMQSLPTDPDFGVRVAAKRAWESIVARVGPPPKPPRGGNPGTGNGRRN
jgi:HEAT repeat protein